MFPQVARMAGRYVIFAPCTLDTEDKRLWVGAKECRDPHLNPLAIKILIHLINKPESTVFASDLRHLLDQQGATEERDEQRTASLVRYVSRLRNYTDQKMRDYLHTISKKRGNGNTCGYRFDGNPIWS